MLYYNVYALLVIIIIITVVIATNYCFYKMQNFESSFTIFSITACKCITTNGQCKCLLKLPYSCYSKEIK